MTDIAVGAVGNVTDTGAILVSGVGTVSINKKPIYLLVLESLTGKTRTLEKFLSLDKPDLLNGFVQVKGAYVENDISVIEKDYINILSSVKKENVVEIMFPWHRIVSMQNLIFKAK
jgi:hypothetical protein